MIKNWAKHDNDYRRHHVRWRARVEKIGIVCPECHGRKGWIEIVDPYLGGPWYDCGLCEGVGKVDGRRWSEWMHYRKKEKQEHRRHPCTKHLNG